ncbi:MAG: hypothetical protein RL091_513, partial [Verrucomicrobiota bacterium]
MNEARTLHSYEPGRPHWWQWLTVLSLDAPLVAVVWQLALAQVAGVTLRAHHTFILGAAVWLAYAVDRWIEGWRISPDLVRTQRHWFYQYWRWPMAILWMLVLVAALVLSFTLLSCEELRTGLLLLGPVLVYLLSHQFIHRDRRWRAPKEICVAALFTIGVASFPVANHPAALAGLAPALAFFGLLCFADCALISLWEDEVDRMHGQTSLALQFPRGRVVVRGLPWGIAVLGAAVAWREQSWLAACAAGSGVLLGSLDLFHRRLGRQLSRALVDVTLMTPAVFLFS